MCHRPAGRGGDPYTIFPLRGLKLTPLFEPPTGLRESQTGALRTCGGCGDARIVLSTLALFLYETGDFTGDMNTAKGMNKHAPTIIGK
jgi:hypothetical protein